jgi:predicted DCC family thiol-disulfide oxidoreductase YuxK
MTRGDDGHDAWLLYDDDCGFCRRWCAWARSRGGDRAVCFVGCAAAVEVRQAAGISESECARAALLVETTASGELRTRRAAAAINGVLRRLPGWRNLHWRIAARLYWVPGVRQLEEAGYRLVARNRHRLGPASCGTAPAPAPASRGSGGGRSADGVAP